MNRVALFAFFVAMFSLSGYAQSNPALKAELERIMESDQAPRKEYVAALRAQHRDSVLIDRLVKTILHNDSVNTVRVTEILDTHGFPTLAEVGDINIAVWAVIQHSDIALIDKYMPQFLDAAKNGDLPKMYVATMYDRCEVWHGRPQKYGTQGTMDENGAFVPSDLLDQARVDEWRDEMGLPPLEEYIRKMNRK